MRLFLTFSFLAVFCISYSQDVPVQFNHLTVKDGLSQKWVKSIYRDRIGYLWIGTADGLNKYDGITIKTYKFSLSDTNSINHNFITAIFEDSKGILWVGTQTGLNKYCRDKDNFTRVSSIPNYIACIFQINKDRFLIGSPGGLFVFNPENLKAIQVNNYLSIVSILQVNSNTFWLGTTNGLYKVDTVAYEFKKLNVLNQGDQIIRSMFKDNQGKIWIGTENQGLFSVMIKKVSHDELIIKNYINDQQNQGSISKGTIYAIANDKDNNLWIGVENGGVNILALNNINKVKPEFLHLEHNPYNLSSLSNNSIHYLYLDNQYTMWVGTFNGLSYTNKLLQKFAHYKQVPSPLSGINNNYINTIYDERKYLFIGTEKGLNVYDKIKNTYQYYTYDEKNINSISSNVVWSVFRDSKGNLWIGTWGGGLCLFNEKNKTFTRFVNHENDTSSIGGNNITKIIEDKKGNLWVACLGGGLNCFNYKTNRFKQYKVNFNQNSLSCVWINDITEDNDGNIWIASTEAVDVFDRKRNHFIKYTNNINDNKSISYDGATKIFKDSKGNMWIGTSNGLNLFNKVNNTFKCFTEDDGLCNNNIMSIEEDDSLNLWISTNKGISKFIKGVNIPDKPKFKNFNISDGLQENEFNVRASYKGWDGLIYFGGPNGYNVFAPGKIRDNTTIPNIVFTNLLIFNKPVKIGDDNNILTNDIGQSNEIELTRKHSVFTIEFAALNLIAPEKNQYAYKLKGFDQQWNNVGKQHSATYTNLDPGNYIFMVKASNSDGLWNLQGASIKLIVKPAWWQSWIAKFCYLIMIILAVYFFRRRTIITINLKNQLWLEHQEKIKLEELNQLKLEFFTNMSHELRTPLTLIIGPLKKLINEKYNAEILEPIYRIANRLKKLVDQIMDFSKIESHMMKLTFERKDVVESILFVLHNFSEYAAQKGISLVYKSDLEKCLADFDEDKLSKILANIVSNAFKNTFEKGYITIKLDYNIQIKSLELSITDTGKGIPPDEIDHIFRNGDGGKICQGLFRIHRGKRPVQIQPGRVNRFSMTTCSNAGDNKTDVIFLLKLRLFIQQQAGKGLANIAKTNKTEAIRGHFKRLQG